jgi:hypothetical protein
LCSPSFGVGLGSGGRSPSSAHIGSSQKGVQGSRGGNSAVPLVRALFPPPLLAQGPEHRAGDLLSQRLILHDIQTIKDGRIAKTYHLENWLSVLGQLRAK